MARAGHGGDRPRRVAPSDTMVMGSRSGSRRRAAVAEPDGARSPGDIVGTYRIDRLLGEGGMGRVYEASHLRLGRKVAIKMLRRSARQPVDVQRFFAEAQAVNRISHENIVEINDFVENDQGESYLIMELLEGRSLARLLHDDGPQPAARVCHIGAQIASALAVVHRAGIVHRDLKPDNVFIVDRRGDRDFVKLIDFGVAKLGPSVETLSSTATHVTAVGTILGTPEYMSPEQASGVAVDYRSDIYALGVILYELVTGERPFAGSSFGDIVVKHRLHVPPHPSRLADRRRPVPAVLDDLVMDCLAKTPEARPQSMEDVEARLRVAASSAPARNRASSSRSARGDRQRASRRALLQVVVLAMAAILVGAGGARVGLSWLTERPPTPTAVAPPRPPAPPVSKAPPVPTPAPPGSPPSYSLSPDWVLPAALADSEPCPDLPACRIVRRRLAGQRFVWAGETRLSVEPLQVLSYSRELQFPAARGRERVEWDFAAFAGWSSFEAAPCSRRGGPRARVVTRGPVLPRVALPAAYTAGGWRSTRLDSCALEIDGGGGARGFTLGGGSAGDPDDARFRVVASAGNDLYLEIHDDRWVGPSAHWSDDDHVAIWVQVPPVSPATCVAADRAYHPVEAVIRVSDGKVFAGHGRPEPLRAELAGTPRPGEPARLHIVLPPGAEAVTVVYSDRDDGQTPERLIATSPLRPGSAVTLGRLLDLSPGRARCVVLDGGLRAERVTGGDEEALIPPTPARRDVAPRLHGAY